MYTCTAHRAQPQAWPWPWARTGTGTVSLPLFYADKHIVAMAELTIADPLDGDVAAIAVAGFVSAVTPTTMEHPALGIGSDSDEEPTYVPSGPDLLSSPYDGARALPALLGWRADVVRPGCDSELLRLQQDHTISMMQLRHEQQLSDQRHVARRAEKVLRTEGRRREKAFAAMVEERDALAASLSRASEQLTQLTEQHALLKRAHARQARELEAARVQAASETSGNEATTLALRQRSEEATTRAAESERVVAELRKELAASQLARQDLQRSVSEGQEALQKAWRDASSAMAAKELLAERVAIHQREAERREDAVRVAAEASHKREDDLRETCAALAAAREQRNQAAREAEADRLSAAETRDALQASEEQVAASEVRISAAERRAVEERFAREKLEHHFDEFRHRQVSARAASQRRMVLILVASARRLCALGFAKWVAAAAAWLATEARAAAVHSLNEVRRVDLARRELLTSLDARDIALFRAMVLGSAVFGALDRVLCAVSAAAAFAHWQRCVLVDSRCVVNWQRLVGRAELVPRLLHRVGEPPGWRLLLRQRTERVRASTQPYLARTWRHCKQGYEGRRWCRLVFALWRQWTCCRLLREQGMVAEARHASLFVSPAPWWEAGGGDAA